MRQRSIAITVVTIVTIVTFAPRFAAADSGRSKGRSTVKTIPLNRKELEPGTTWWCWTRPDAGRCMRTRESCESLGSRCTEQKVAHAFSLRLRSTFDSLGTFDAEPEVFDSREHCEAVRRAYVKQDNNDAGPEVVSRSACTVVGAKALPPLKPLPSGRGFWCVAYTVNASTMMMSACSRGKRHCARVVEVLGTPAFARTFGTVTITSECELRQTGWAWIDTKGATRFYSDVYADRQACEALRMGTGEVCREVN